MALQAGLLLAEQCPRLRSAQNLYPVPLPALLCTAAGSPAVPASVAVAQQFVYSFSSGLQLRISAPASDVAKLYTYKFDHYTVWGDASTKGTVTGSIARFDSAHLTDQAATWLLTVDLAQATCAPACSLGRWASSWLC